MKKRKLIPVLMLLLTTSSFAQTADATITKIFRNSYYTIKMMRQSNGIYLDALAINVTNKPAAIAANGVGLVSLCIADAMYKKTGDATNWEANATNLVDQTLTQFITFKNSGATNSSNLFRRYFNYNTGFQDGGWSQEYSTVDNGIFAMGLVFCKNYFSSNSTIVSKANELLGAMDFTAAISDNSQQLYMILDQYGLGSAPTGAFNEYMIVSWLAKNSSSTNSGFLKSQNYWNTFYNNPTTNSISHPDYWGYTTISDGWFISDFVPQFTYYYCNYHKNNPDYMYYLRNAKKADSLWWTKASPGINSYEWGLGAGEDPGDGYSANSVENNNNRIVSPHIIAGFIPVSSRTKAISDLKNLYNLVPASRYTLPGTSRIVLWRYSRNNTSLRCKYIQAVDFSTMLYGLACLPEYLGPDFFNTYNSLANISLKSTSLETSFEQPFSTSMKSQVDIFNMKGVLIKKQLMDGSFSIDKLEKLEKGFYIIKINNGTRIENKKIVLQ